MLRLSFWTWNANQIRKTYPPLVLSGSRSLGPQGGNTPRHWPIVDSMLDHRLRCWPSFDPAMGECLVLSEKGASKHETLWTNVNLMLAQSRRRWPTLNQHWFSVSCLLGYYLIDSRIHPGGKLRVVERDSHGCQKRGHVVYCNARITHC